MYGFSQDPSGNFSSFLRACICLFIFLSLYTIYIPGRKELKESFSNIVTVRCTVNSYLLESLLGLGPQIVPALTHIQCNGRQRRIYKIYIVTYDCIYCRDIYCAL